LKVLPIKLIRSQLWHTCQYGSGLLFPKSGAAFLRLLSLFLCERVTDSKHRKIYNFLKTAYKYYSQPNANAFLRVLNRFAVSLMFEIKMR